MRVLRKRTSPRYERDNITSYLFVSGKTCESRTLTTTLVEMQPGGLQRVHAHEPEQMYYILEGAGTITAGEETEHVSAGDCIFFPSLTPHGLENTGRGLLRYFSAASPSFSAPEVERLWPLQSEAEAEQ